jgi:hypothetical protein
MHLVQQLSSSKLDIIGDIHGEYDALIKLIKNLGYDLDGNHVEGRKLIFVGDLCDRGSNSPGVIKLVKRLIENNNAQAILGNHELNLLQMKAKLGSGWFFEEAKKRDVHYEPFVTTDKEDKSLIYNFLATLPLVLENKDLRIVHAAWDSQKIKEIRELKEFDIAKCCEYFEEKINEDIKQSGLLDRYREEAKQWGDELLKLDGNFPYLNAISEYKLVHQMNNPIKVITSGVERKCETPFYANGTWRFVERFSWWDHYNEDIPVVVGHFWRKFNNKPRNEGEPNIFENIENNAWHGKNNNVFCIDFSVGGRFLERLNGDVEGTDTALVALRWPENELVLETGMVIPTADFKKQPLQTRDK